MSGYYSGAQIVNQFMEALTSGDGDALTRADALIAGETDPRKVEVFTDLKALLESKIVR